MDAHSIFAYSAVATAPSPATSGTSLVVSAGQGALFPAVPFYATICPTGAAPLSTNSEIVRVTARSTDTFTITRAQVGTSARTVVVGDQIFQPVLPLELDPLTSSSNYVTPAAITMTTAGTYYDGPSLTLAAGTWLLVGAVNLLAISAASRSFNARLWDGTTVVSYSGHVVPGTAVAAQVVMPLSGIVSPGTSTTYKISATSTVNGDQIMGAAPFDKSGYLNAVRIG